MQNVIFIFFSYYICGMTAIRPYLQKKAWFRRSPRVTPETVSFISDTADYAMTIDDGQGYRLTQSDFLDELVPSAHKINHCAYRANRPKYKYNPTTQKNEEDGMDEVERVEIGFQEGALRHKVTTTFGNEMWFGPEGKDEANDARVANIRSHWNISGMTDALNTWGRALFGTGDAAIYLYRDGDEVRYKVFSYEKGDVFNFTRDENNNPIFVRMMMVSGREAVEIYDDKKVSLWVTKDETGVDEGFLTKVINILKGKPLFDSDDGFTCIASKSHGCSQMPVMYYRLNDVVWGVGQAGIERIERILSDLGENNRYYAYQILFIAGAVMSLPPVGRQGKTIASKTTDGKAEILQPADASNTFTIDLEKNLELLCETLALVIINPKDLKAGENTGAFIRNLYWREVQWSINVIAELRPSFTKLISIFKELVGQIENQTELYKKTKLSFLLEPYVPKNVMEEITNVCMAKNAGVTSTDTAAGEIPFNNPRESEKLKREQIERQAREDAVSLLKKKVQKVEIEPPIPGKEGEGANNQAK